MIKYTKEELYKMDAVDVYKMVLSGKIIKNFPSGYWTCKEARQNAAKCTRYVIEEILKYDDEMLKQKLSKKLFVENRLSGMLTICFNSSPYKTIDNAYPGKFKEWEFKSVTNNCWDNKNKAKEATKWLIEEKLKLTDEELREQLSYNLFIDNGLGGMINSCFNASPFEAINEVYPDKYKEWEFNTVPMKFWDDIDNGIKATKWLIEDKLNLSETELKEQLSLKLFLYNGLNGMLARCFNGSPYEAINTAYPGKYKEWEFSQVSNNYWKNKENGIRAVKWLIEEKLKLSQEELKKQLSQKMFKNNNLSGMLHQCFNGSPYEAINAAYPNKFKRSDLKGYK